MTDNEALGLHLRHVVSATRERVYTALTNPDMLTRWWGPRGFSIPSAEIDLRLGGRYRITMQPPAGSAFHLSGIFRRIEPPSHLAHTFVWEEPDSDDRATVVTLSLRELGKSTELVMDQGPFATPARHALHQQGWSESLEKLELLMPNLGSRRTQ